MKNIFKNIYLVQICIPYAFLVKQKRRDPIYQTTILVSGQMVVLLLPFIIYFFGYLFLIPLLILMLGIFFFNKKFVEIYLENESRIKKKVLNMDFILLSMLLILSNLAIVMFFLTLTVYFPFDGVGVLIN